MLPALCLTPERALFPGKSSRFPAVCHTSPCLTPSAARTPRPDTPQARGGPSRKHRQEFSMSHGPLAHGGVHSPRLAQSRLSEHKAERRNRGAQLPPLRLPALPPPELPVPTTAARGHARSGGTSQLLTRKAQATETCSSFPRALLPSRSPKRHSSENPERRSTGVNGGSLQAREKKPGSNPGFNPHAKGIGAKGTLLRPLRLTFWFPQNEKRIKSLAGCSERGRGRALQARALGQQPAGQVLTNGGSPATRAQGSLGSSRPNLSLLLHLGPCSFLSGGTKVRAGRSLGFPSARLQNAPDLFGTVESVRLTALKNEPLAGF